MLSVSRTLAFSCFPPLVDTAQFSNNYLISRHLSHLWQHSVFLLLLTCHLIVQVLCSGRKEVFFLFWSHSSLYNINRTTCWKDPLMTHSSFLHSGLGLCRLTHWPFLLANCFAQSFPLPLARPPHRGSHMQAVHRNHGHGHRGARLMKSSFNSMVISTSLLSIYIFNIWLAF